jgi:hypothetical protein
MLASSRILQGTRGSQVLPFSILRRTVWFGLVWSGSIQYFQQTKPTNFRVGLNFLDQQFQVQWFFDPYNNLHFGVSGSPVSAFE